MVGQKEKTEKIQLKSTDTTRPERNPEDEKWQLIDLFRLGRRWKLSKDQEEERDILQARSGYE
ncbi:MAG TPA: hypothetical protein VJB96_00220 [Patescibacteria group bacterium]|nr:hypothetical protein [Patescibacteria group bacterium]